MFHIIYKTTNIVNNNFYIGYHCQNSNPYSFDGYLGSGTILNNAIKKYGADNFRRETLFVFDEQRIALEKEAEIVNENFIKRSDVYNKTLGGGLPPSHKGIPKSKSHRQKISNSQKGKILSENTINKIKLARSKQTISHSKKTKQKIAKALLGKTHSETSKKKMSENHWDCSGNKNPCYGKKGSNHPAFGTKRQLLICPHCKNEVPVNVAKRWHFDNCNSKMTKS